MAKTPQPRPSSATASRVLAGAPAEFRELVAKTVGAVYARFARAIPGPVHSSGHFAAPGDGAEWACRVPDGKYRVSGADWFVVVRDERVVEINRAVAPDFGGDDVIAV